MASSKEPAAEHLLLIVPHSFRLRAFQSIYRQFVTQVSTLFCQSTELECKTLSSDNFVACRHDGIYGMMVVLLQRLLKVFQYWNLERKAE